MNTLHRIFTYLIASVWLINGLFCKMFNLVPRHQEIVSRILGAAHAEVLTKLIGASEVLMAIWVISRILPRLNAWTQIIIIAMMNTLEFVLVPDLLLWGKMNSVFALSFIVFIYCNEFILKPKQA